MGRRLHDRLGRPGVLVAALESSCCGASEDVLLTCASLVPLAARAIGSAGSPRPATHLRAPVRGACGRRRGRRLRRSGRRPRSLALVVAQLAWAWDKTPRSSSGSRASARRRRADAAAYLASTSQPTSPFRLRAALPRRLGANGDFPVVTLPRADANLALLDPAEVERPLGHGVWVLDASKPNNAAPRCRSPDLHHDRLRRSRYAITARSSSSARPSRREPGRYSSAQARRRSSGRRSGPRRCRHQPAHDRAGGTGATRLRRALAPCRRAPGSKAPPRRQRALRASRGGVPSAATGAPPRSPRMRRRPHRRGRNACVSWCT